MAKSIPDKKFIEIIKHFPIDKIAFGRFGSRAVEGIEFYIIVYQFHCILLQVK